MAIPAVLLVGLLWGLNWPIVKIMLTEIEPLTIRAVAFPAAAAVLALICVARGQTLRPPRAEVIPLCVTGFFLVFGFNALASLGQVLVESSRAAIIAYTMPVITAVLAAVFLGDRLSGRVILALVVGMGGLVVLAFEDLPALINEPLGPAIMMLAALVWSIGNICVKTWRWSLPPLSMAAWFFAVSSVVVWPLVLVFEPPWEQAMPGAAVLMTLGFHILGPMVTCYLLWTALLERLPATVAAISVLTAPVVGVLSAALLLEDDPLTWGKGIALAMIVLSIAATLMGSRKAR